MSDIKPYEQIEDLALTLRSDGRSDCAEKLLRAHEGIFNGTELYFTWIGCIEGLLKRTDLSHLSRQKAETLLERLRKEFYPKTYGMRDAPSVPVIPLFRDPNDPKDNETKH